ncbi:histone-lysine N-methyltransferase SETMAR [Ditylenchus destructor]|nr:histone-lysine N-methyltransferase SETMAR [Ditylenchus destructor]
MEKNRGVIRELLKYEFELGHTAKEAVENINRAKGAGTVAQRTAERWFSNFRSDKMDIEDKPRSGRPREIDRDAVVNAVEELTYVWDITGVSKDSPDNNAKDGPSNGDENTNSQNMIDMAPVKRDISGLANHDTNQQLVNYGCASGVTVEGCLGDTQTDKFVCYCTGDQCNTPAAFEEKAEEKRRKKRGISVGAKLIQRSSVLNSDQNEAQSRRRRALTMRARRNKRQEQAVNNKPAYDSPKLVIQDVGFANTLMQLSRFHTNDLSSMLQPSSSVQMMPSNGTGNAASGSLATQSSPNSGSLAGLKTLPSFVTNNAGFIPVNGPVAMSPLGGLSMAPVSNSGPVLPSASFPNLTNAKIIPMTDNVPVNIGNVGNVISSGPQIGPWNGDFAPVGNGSAPAGTEYYVYSIDYGSHEDTDYTDYINQYGEYMGSNPLMSSSNGRNMTPLQIPPQMKTVNNNVQNTNSMGVAGTNGFQNLAAVNLPADNSPQQMPWSRNIQNSNKSFDALASVFSEYMRRPM